MDSATPESAMSEYREEVRSEEMLRFLKKEKRRRYEAQRTGAICPREYNLTKAQRLERKYGIKEETARPKFYERGIFFFPPEPIEDDYERIEKKYPPPITPDPMPEDLDLVVGDFKSHSITSK